jgi:regulator of cell morphogenesis and NO signaling
MPITIDNTTTVRELAVSHPEARQVLEALGIDYCCGGGNRLTDAAAEAGIDLVDVVKAVEQAAADADLPGSAPERDWQGASLTDLVDHIESTHHVFMKQALPRLGGLFVKVLRAHGPKHGDMLTPLQTTFQALRSEIEMHLMKEEQILFPYIRQMEASLKQAGRIPPMHCGTVQNPIRQMVAEHENAGAALARMRSVTGDYALPEDACPTFRALFDGLREMEADLHEHIHLENNILFPRSEAMEAEG